MEEKIDVCSIDQNENCTSVTNSDFTKTVEENSIIEESEEEIKDLKSVDDDLDVFFFESDHLALKGNPDYHVLLHCLSLLQAQKMRAINDLETLYNNQSDALKSPVEFVEKLQKKILDLPKPQKLVEVPEINWEKYGVFAKIKLFSDNRFKSRSKYSEDDTSSNDPQNQSVRGRISKENKSKTFNRLWTAEEQKKLEDLLIKYPPEIIENKRWQKIASELGDRTTTQVASRVQKYFIKLAQAGLPIPGRVPNPHLYNKKGSQQRFQKYHKHKYHPSTFFASYEPPVFMPEEDDSTNNLPSNDVDGMDWHHIDEEFPPELMHTSEYKELMILKEMKEKLIRKEMVHSEFKCDNCDIEPIIGIRWHCTSCSLETSVDYCDNCISRVKEENLHFSNHQFETISSSASSFVDSDYQSFPSQYSNYLDPNFMASTM